MHICLSKLTSIGSDNGLSPGQCQATNWTNAGILLIGSLATNFSEVSIEIYTFLFNKMYLKLSSAKCCHQAIIWTNAGILLIGSLATNFSEISIEICIFPFNKMHLKLSSKKCKPFCLGLNLLINGSPLCHWGPDKTTHVWNTNFDYIVLMCIGQSSWFQVIIASGKVLGLFQYKESVLPV